MNKFNKVALALCGAMTVASWSGQAAAAPVIVCDEPANPTACTFGNTNPDGYPPHFLDIYTFAIPFAKKLSATIFSVYPTDPTDFNQNVNFITPQGVQLLGGTLAGAVNFTIVSEGNPELRTLDNVLLGAGTYQVRVNGASAVDGQYNGTLSFGAVPEPASWALMILGFGLTGAAIRRRKQSEARVQFA